MSEKIPKDPSNTKAETEVRYGEMNVKDLITHLARTKVESDEWEIMREQLESKTGLHVPHYTDPNWNEVRGKEIKQLRICTSDDNPDRLQALMAKIELSRRGTLSARKKKSLGEKPKHNEDERELDRVYTEELKRLKLSYPTDKDYDGVSRHGWQEEEARALAKIIIENKKNNKSL